jgi:lysophospholipase L1-like esterase
MLAQFHPEVVILLEGVNDLNGGDSVDSGPVLDALRLMARDAKASGATVLLCTLPPQREGGSRAFAADRIANFNSHLPNIARLEDVMLVDIFPLIDPAESAGDLTPDGLHITDQGNQKLAQKFFEVIRGLFEIPAPAPAASR